MSDKKSKIEELEEQIRSLQQEVESLKDREKVENGNSDMEEEADASDRNMIVQRPPGVFDGFFSDGLDDIFHPMFSFGLPFLTLRNRNPHDHKKKKKKKKEGKEDALPPPLTFRSNYSYSKVGDLIHEKKKVEDSRRGITKEVESRTIGDRSVRMERKTEKGESKPTVKRIVQNLEMEDVDRFEKEWKERVTGKKRKRIDGDRGEEKVLEPPHKKRKED